MEWTTKVRDLKPGETAAWWSMDITPNPEEEQRVIEFAKTQLGEENVLAIHTTLRIHVYVKATGNVPGGGK